MNNFLDISLNSDILMSKSYLPSNSDFSKSYLPSNLDFSKSYLPSNLDFSKMYVNDSNTKNKLNDDKFVERIKESFSREYLESIKNEDLEFGIFGNTTKLVNNFLKYNNKDIILTEIQKLCLDNHKDKRLVYSVLHTFAHLDYDLVYPHGPIFALGMSRYKDIDIQDFSIQCFEIWCNKNSLSYLEQINIDTPWLNEYLQKTIQYIKDS